MGRFVANLPAIAGELASKNKKIWKIYIYPGLDTTHFNHKMPILIHIQLIHSKKAKKES